MRALVVDDSKAIRMILGKMLIGLGLAYEEAANGEEALQVLQRDQDFTLGLIDWNMPVMDGLTLVKLIREDPGFNDMKLVMVTTESELSSVAKAMEAGASEYVMKPFTQEVITEKLTLLGLAAG